MNREFRNHPDRTFQRPDERTIKEHTIQVEKKEFSIALKENRGGRFVRVTETKFGKRNTVIVPLSGVESFVQAFSIVLDALPPGHNTR